jgi:hypothetical protein
LLLLKDVLVAAPTSAFVNATNEQNVLNAYTDLLLKRGDVDSSGTSNGADVAALYSSFGSPTWTMDLNVDGEVDTGDVQTMISDLFRTAPGDFNVDGKVDAADYVVWRKTMDDPERYDLWRTTFGNPSGAGAGLAGQPPAVPEPGAIGALFVLVVGALGGRPRRSRRFA